MFVKLRSKLLFGGMIKLAESKRNGQFTTLICTVRGVCAAVFARVNSRY